MKFISVLTVVLYFYYLCQVSIKALSPEDEAADPDGILSSVNSYCFEFTWFGPKYDNVSTYNGTCADYLDDTRGKNIPCNPPIVITFDGSPPDMEYLWKNHRTNVLCRRANSQVCARYTYKYNNAVQNATYMCTQAQVVGEGAVTRGCYKQHIEGYEIEACFCESGRGIFKPCNAFGAP